MGAYIAKRLLLTIPVLVGVAFIVFVMVRIIPGDPAQVIAGEAATREFVEEVRRELGLDRPILVQFGDFIPRLTRGDLGHAMRTPNPPMLAAAGIAIATVVGVLAGIISAVRPYSLVDTAVILAALAGLSM